MACFPDKGRIVPCKDSMAGVKGLYFVDFGTMTVGFDVTQTNVIDDLGAITALQYDIRSATSLGQTVTSGAENGTQSVAQVITAILQKEEWSTDAELLTLAAGRPHVVVHYKRGDARVVGLYEGTSLETIESASGAAANDLNGYTVTINGEEEALAPFLKGATKTNPFAGLTTTPTVTVGAEVEPA